MPFNPTKFYPRIIENLKREGYEKVSRTRLEVEIIRTLGVVTPKTINRNIQVLEKLGYIEREENKDVWVIKG